MLSFYPESQSERENYKLLIGSIIPRPIAFVTTKAVDGTLNGAPFSYFNIVSSNPPMVSLAIQRKNGNMKDTARNITENGEFVIHIVDEQNVDNINKTAATLPSNKSEITIAGLTPIPSERISVPGVQEAKVRFECKLEQIIALDAADGEKGSDLILGKIITYYIDEEIYEDGKINPVKLAAISRLAGANYAKVGEIFSIERPK
ncbi:flavin reductase family protein [Ornithinibacillus sp. BX22]|uniref:Flavin reductase family protein n=1 Tax=Ornithinibacillus hominis TaxID=2763055 RepID=A0A923L5L4_9BACI|nr:flavin reductase family protein [Ornithinibacillus hominis]MBC5636805.1 flavin reductase family protein [Ornithinibacillus hominis]